MFRKLLLILMAAISLIAAIVFIWGRFQFVHWRLVPLSHQDTTVAILITNGSKDAGISTTWYAKGTGEEKPDEWSWQFETLRLSWKRHVGSCQTAWAGHENREYEGYGRMELVGPWWAPLFVCLFFGMWPFLSFWDGPLLRWRRRRRGLCVWCGNEPPGSVESPCSKCGRTAEGKRLARPEEQSQNESSRGD